MKYKPLLRYNPIRTCFNWHKDFFSHFQFVPKMPIILLPLKKSNLASYFTSILASVKQETIVAIHVTILLLTELTICLFPKVMPENSMIEIHPLVSMPLFMLRSFGMETQK